MSDLDYNKTIKINEISIIRDELNKIGSNIKMELDKRVESYSRSILHKYYNNLYYFLPKHCLVEIQDYNHQGYNITPEQKFFIHDKKNNFTFTYTPRIQINVLPVKEIYAQQLNKNSITITLNFEKNINYDKFSIWLDPRFSEKKPYLANHIMSKILSLTQDEIYARVALNEGGEVTKKVTVSELKYNLPPTTNISTMLHSNQLANGFNIKIENLFNYKSNEIKQITFFLKLKEVDYNSEEIKDLFKVNLVPLFNIYEDYSYNTYADISLSSVTLKHFNDKHSIPISILTIEENNELLKFNGYYFSGKNEYYFNVSDRALNFNTIMPDLSENISNIKLRARARWTQNLEVSQFIEISTNATSFKSKILPLVNNAALSNSNYKDSKLYDFLDKLNSFNVFSRATFQQILEFLQVDSDKISFFMSLIEKVEMNKLNSNLVITTSPKYLKKDTYLMDFYLKVICIFINQNSYNFVKEIVINKLSR